MIRLLEVVGIMEAYIAEICLEKGRVFVEKTKVYPSEEEALKAAQQLAEETKFKIIIFISEEEELKTFQQLAKERGLEVEIMKKWWKE